MRDTDEPDDPLASGEPDEPRGPDDPREPDGPDRPDRPPPAPPPMPVLPGQVTADNAGQVLEVIGELARQVFTVVTDEHTGWTREQLLSQAVATQAAINSLGATRLERIARFARDSDGDVDEFASDELAPHFGWGPRQADGTIADAVDATSHAPGLLALAGQGRLEPWRIAIVTHQVAGASWRTREKVEHALIEAGICSWTGGRIRRRTRALIARLEPAAERRAATERAKAAIGVRCYPGCEPGTTDWHATLPARDAQQAHAAVEALAAEMHASTTTGKTLGQCRADAMCDLILANAHVTTHATLLLPVTTGEKDNTTGSTPHAATPAGDAATTPDAATPDAATRGVKTTDARAPQASGGGTPRRPLSPETLEGRVDRWVRGDHAAISDVDIPGIGTIDRDTILTLLHDLDTRIATAIIDHATGSLIGIASATYRPPTRIRRHVELRDQHCRFPTCDKPARWCDLDHVTRWPDGPTDVANLQLLCRHHHRAKHETGWTLTMEADGTCHWTSPTGHHFTTTPGLTETTTHTPATTHTA